MGRLFFLVANGMAGFQDIGVGVLLAVLLELATGVPHVTWHLIVGGLLGVFPDLFDLVPKLLIGRSPKKGEDHHQSFFHRPLFMIPLVTVLFAFLDSIVVGQWFFVYLASTCLFYHYLHDTWSGIAWLFPFKEEYPIPGRGWVKPKDSKMVIGHQLWLQTYWYHPTKLSVPEVLIGTLTLSGALFLVYGAPVGITALIIPLLGAVLFWTLVALSL